ncbi:hypothetical protein BX659_1572 [Orenia metallireducens]|uniref:Uncharacterized protein n=1 Tax=Orenia metallireducens TaxID=1413210 RepID=A0A285IIB5_9FIRM|nr:hypothetical protein [Orenia metallireducens]PRX17187.1 hypothetical protein BX659_1572 [Orenia metallireducens]SNY47725.1 hypothetical protein SAMN06265827_1572 [Orenia metallireducens]
MDKIKIWNDFCKEYNVLEKGVPLFETDGLFVNSFDYGKKVRKILKRNEEMENLVISEVNKVIDDFNSGKEDYEGLIYMMYWKRDNGVIPLYIGKSEKYGRKGGNLSINIANIERNRGKFCRWGYNYAYHIGDLSAIVLPGHSDKKKNRKYKEWGDRLFEEVNSITPKLREETYFWIRAWRKEDIGPWEEFGQTSLTFLEYLLIGLASDIFTDTLLNYEGVNRK